MPFINNQKENFKKSDSAWGDDNITYYNTPNAKPMQRMGDMNIQNMSYQDLEDITRDERDDAFEPKDTTIKEDVIETTIEPIELSMPVDDMLIDDGYTEPENKTNDFVIAGLIIILAITLID